MTTDNNIETSKLLAEIGYLTGVSKDLTTLIQDSVTDRNIRYFFYNSQNSSDSAFYYRSINLDSATKKLVDSLNLTNKKLAEKLFVIKTIENANTVQEDNIKIRGWIMNILSIVSFILFLFGLYKWYRERNKIDK